MDLPPTPDLPNEKEITFDTLYLPDQTVYASSKIADRLKSKPKRPKKLRLKQKQASSLTQLPKAIKQLRSSETDNLETLTLNAKDSIFDQLEDVQAFEGILIAEQLEDTKRDG